MTDSRRWDEIYAAWSGGEPRCDLWLEPFAGLLDTCQEHPVLDLGCGAGNNALYLSRRGHEVIACDYSSAALELIRERLPDVQALHVDLREKLPFADHSAAAVVADLSLHYFPWEQTVVILSEIHRVLVPGGFLFCRLNSTRDTAYGAGQGTELEPHYYEWQGHRKRFFEPGQLARLFAGWEVLRQEEQSVLRYEQPKVAWMVAARHT